MRQKVDLARLSVGTRSARSGFTPGGPASGRSMIQEIFRQQTGRTPVPHTSKTASSKRRQERRAGEAVPDAGHAPARCAPPGALPLGVF